MLSDFKAVALVPCKDLANTRKFYEETLGFKPRRETPAGIAYASGGGEFGLYPTEHGGAAGHTLMGWLVDDVEATVTELGAKGITFEQYDFPGLKTNEKGIADLDGEKGAWFKDPEGNIISVFDEGG